ncbi:MAG: hypothetical protein C0404_01810 [Verrucomicrobia bacterium]|nr:hypothetical protein [Verrucomicrobiota bacterium]
MVTIVTGKRQLTVPAEIARELGIEAGTSVDWERKDATSITLTVLPGRKQLIARAREIGRKYRDSGGDSATIIRRERDRDELERMKELRVADGPAVYGTPGKGRKA